MEKTEDRPIKAPLSSNNRKINLNKNREYSEKYFQKKAPIEIHSEMEKVLLKKRCSSVIDLGCGEGQIIEELKKKFPDIKITGVDISPRRIELLKKKFPKDTFLVSDCCHTKLRKKFDFVISSMVIEHVFDDKQHVFEISRLLKKGGFLFCSSVIRRPFGVYIYRNKGKFVLDPTHERESI